MEKTDFEYRLLHLHLLINQIKFANKSIKFLDSLENAEDIIVTGTAFMIWQLLVIHIESYRDELQGCKSQFKSEGKIELLQNIGYIEKKINEKWPDLNTFRSQVVAHNYRNRGGNISYLKTKKMIDYKAPLSGADYTSLSGHVIVLHGLIVKEYSNEFKIIQTEEIDFLKD